MAFSIWSAVGAAGAGGGGAAPGALPLPSPLAGLLGRPAGRQARAGVRRGRGRGLPQGLGSQLSRGAEPTAESSPVGRPAGLRTWRGQVCGGTLGAGIHASVLLAATSVALALRHHLSGACPMPNAQCTLRPGRSLLWAPPTGSNRYALVCSSTLAARLLKPEARYRGGGWGHPRASRSIAPDGWGPGLGQSQVVPCYLWWLQCWWEHPALSPLL